MTNTPAKLSFVTAALAPAVLMATPAMAKDDYRLTPLEEPKAPEHLSRKLCKNDCEFTISTPVFVVHTSPRGPNADKRPWNEGFFKNEGAFVTLTKEVGELAGGTFEAGVIGGAYDNSVNRKSVLAGAVTKINYDLSDDVEVGIGTYFGAVTGYTRGGGIKPALTPVLDAAFKLNDNIKIKAGMIYMPAATLGGRGADAFSAVIGLSKSF